MQRCSQIRWELRQVRQDEGLQELRPRLCVFGEYRRDRVHEPWRYAPSLQCDNPEPHSTRASEYR